MSTADDNYDDDSVFETDDSSLVAPAPRQADAKPGHQKVASAPVLRPATAELNIPKTPLKEKYEFLTVLGAGGAGVIYKAKQQPLGRMVAVKMIHSHLMTPTAVKRFQQEATTIGRIAHPNIISVYDFGISEENQPFMVMDYVEGVPLSDILDSAGQLSVEDTKQITRQLCDGLGHAHSKGILHRDLKPSNIMMVPVDNGPDIAKILDFGLAKIVYGEEEEDEREHLTKTGETVGTPAFMSPEQVMGKELDLRSDLYSLGCVMYHCLTGEPPFVGETKMETMLMHLNSKPEPINPTEGPPLISPYLEAIILKLLEKHPDNRFQSMADVKAAIDATEKGLFLTPPAVQSPAKAEAPASSTASTSTLPVPAVSPMANALNGLLTPKTLLVVLIVTGVLAIPLIASYIWINAYPSKPKAEKKKTTVKLPGHDPYREEHFDDDAFKGRFDPEDTSITAHHDPFITDNALECLEGSRYLQRVDLSEAPKITDKGMKHLRGVNITHLNINKTRTRDGVKEWLPKMVGPEGLPSLVDLKMSETKVTDDVIPTLRLLPRLEALDLSVNHEITSAGAKSLGMQGLKHLNLASTMVGDDGMDGVAKAPDLIWLDLSGTKVTDAGVKKLLALSNLQELNLSNTVISDEAVKMLTKMKSLCILHLAKTGITDQCFPAIFKKDQISWLDITGCEKITPAQANDFRHKMLMEGRTVQRHESSGGN